MKGSINNLLSMLLILVMVLTLFSGCSTQSKGDNYSTTNKYDDFITIDVFSSQANYQGIQAGWFGRVIKDKFNMEINIIAPNVAGGGETLFQTRLAAGNIGDIVMFGADSNRLENTVSAGLLIDLSEYKNRMPHAMEYTGAIEMVQNYLGSKKGIFAFPSSVTSYPPTAYGESTEPTFGPYLRWDLYTEIGSPEMETLEDLLPVLKRMQQLNPVSDSGKKTYGFSLFKDWDGNMMMMGKQPSCFYGYDETGFVLSKADGSDIQSLISSDSFYIRALKLYFDANQLDLLDPESLTQNWDMTWNKYVDGSVLFSPWPWLGQSAYNTKEHLDAGKGFMLASIQDMNILSYGSTPTGSDHVVGIGSKAQDPERMVDFIDWLYSPEGIMMATTAAGSTSGPEGLTWEMVNDRPELTEFGIKAMLEGGTTLPEEWGGDSWNDGVNQLNFTTVSVKDINVETGFSYDFRLWDSYIEFTSTPIHKSWQEQMGALTTFDYLENHNQYIVSPGIDFISESESSYISTIRADVKTIIVSYSWKMVFAKSESEFYALLQQMQDTAYELGYEKVLAWDVDIVHKLNEARDIARNKSY